MNSISLKKGDVLNLSKGHVIDLIKDSSLKKIDIGLGWDTRCDLDTIAFLTDSNGIIKDTVYFGSKNKQGIFLNGDNRTGAGEGDDERIDICLDQINPAIQRIVFVVSIFEAQAKRQTFGMVDNSFVRLLDADQNEKEICRFNLKEDGSAATSVIFAELYREGQEWQFKAIGEGKIADLNGILALYQ